jgi:glyoxylase-like metal-dependent hydrolase (beta-lactamase superfamily II)/8-oxo-dGTP pyrophosphatase MutT (NUDIX family)
VIPAEPRTAAACILVRGDAEPELLLVKRNATLKFMAGHHVFPGGRVHDEESVERVVHATDADHARAVLTAAREVFEETGLLCVSGTLPPAAVTGPARLRLLADELDFAAWLAEHGLIVDAADFAPAGAWLTPPFLPIRFATQYFLHHVRGDQQPRLVEGEIVALDWFTPGEARARWMQGQIHISTPVAYTLRQLAAVSLQQALANLQRGTEREPGEHNWFEVRRGITLVPVKSATLPPATHTNCLIVGEEELYVIDPGAIDATETAHLVRQIDHLHELGGRLQAIVLSHSHPDHVSAAVELRDRYQVPILAHPATAAQLDFPIDRPLHDGDVLASGRDPQWRLECIHTPGHDPGHLCFLETSTGALLAGDMVANPGTIVVSREFGGDMTDFMRSLEKLIDVDCRLIIPAHGQPLGSPREFLGKQLEHRRWREDKIRAAHEAGAATFDELLARAYDDAPAAALPWARHSLDAHLAKLGIELR